jgi:uncharacterized DUF497 family protein
MAFFQFVWTGESVAHLSEHGVSQDDFETVVNYPERRGKSRSTGRPCCWGETGDGRYLLCVYEYLDVLTVVPITAYEVSRPRR